MNARQLSRNIGQLFRLRPLPWRFDGDGQRLPDSDDSWKLQSVTNDPAGISIKNISTGHALELESDNIMERRSPDFLMLRCQIMIRPTGIALEPIHRGAPIEPSEPMVPQLATGPRLVNAPPGYERQLNYHRYRILKEKAARSLDGGYRYPVRLKGPDTDIRSFSREFNAMLGVFETITRSSQGVTELEFTYSGPATPEIVENLAIKHRITVLQCGNSFTG
jgi:hypothetical protein